LQKICRKSADAGLFIIRNANSGAAWSPSAKFSQKNGWRATAGHIAANACHHHGWRRWYAFVSVDQGPSKARGAARREISDCRYSPQHLPNVRTALNLRVQAVKQLVITRAHSGGLQLRHFFTQLGRYSHSATKPGGRTVVQGNRRCGEAKHALFTGAAV